MKDTNQDTLYYAKLHFKAEEIRDRIPFHEVVGLTEKLFSYIQPYLKDRMDDAWWSDDYHPPYSPRHRVVSENRPTILTWKDQPKNHDDYCIVECRVPQVSKFNSEPLPNQYLSLFFIRPDRAAATHDWKNNWHQVVLASSTWDSNNYTQIARVFSDYPGIVQKFIDLYKICKLQDYGFPSCEDLITVINRYSYSYFYPNKAKPQHVVLTPINKNYIDHQALIFELLTGPGTYRESVTNYYLSFQPKKECSKKPLDIISSLEIPKISNILERLEFIGDGDAMYHHYNDIYYKIRR